MDNSKRDESFQLYLDKVNIQELLKHAGYVNNRRDGLRYPTYVLLDNDGRRISGSKFIVNPHTNTCYHPPEIRNFNVISFITEHPDIFPEKADNPYRLVHEVCRNILNLPPEERKTSVLEPVGAKPFNINDYDRTYFSKNDWESKKQFGPFFIGRGINLSTQSAFSRSFMLATRKPENDMKKGRTNLSFPMFIPGKSGIVGLEERGYPRLDGSSGYKGMARGSNASEGLWIANLSGKKIGEARNVYWFESAYDAMAYYQMNSKNPDVQKGVYVSTGGNPGVMQMRGMLVAAPMAVHHAAFDNDLAGRQFAANLQDSAKAIDSKVTIIREVPLDGTKDWNDALIRELKEEIEESEQEEKEAAGVDLDADGEVEISESEEKKHHVSRYFGR